MIDGQAVRNDSSIKPLLGELLVSNALGISGAGKYNPGNIAAPARKSVVRSSSKRRFPLKRRHRVALEKLLRLAQITYF